MIKKLCSLVLAAALVMPAIGVNATVFAEAQTSAQASSNQSYEWGRAKVVGGGFVPGIIYNESEKDLIYARTDMGGAYRWDPETSKWIQLMDFVSFDEWNMLGVESLATDPVDPDRVYIASGTYTNDWTDMNGVMLRSTDRGDTWQRTEMPFKMGGNMPGRNMGERLSIDPNDNRILYFGARSGNGLWRSADYGETWSKVDSFTAAGNVVDYYNDKVGVAWVVFDKSTGTAGHATQTIYVGVADTGNSIYRSVDGGATWEAVPGQPAEGFLPNHGALSSTGMLYVTYAKELGPYNGGEGSVHKLNTKTGEWQAISPTKDTANPYGGLAIDAQHPDTIMVATMNKWWPDEFIYRSTDGGATWEDMWTLDYGRNPTRVNNYTLNYEIAPWLDWGEEKSLPESSPKLGWMIGDLEIDPFNSDRIMYGTGATLYGSTNMTNLDHDGIVDIEVYADGIEETAILGLVSPPSGAPLLSAMGDIGGFRHEDLNKAPEMITNPYLGSSTDIDFAELNPDIVVRVGNHGGDGAERRMGVSTDNGKTWTPAANAWAPLAGDQTDGGWVAVGADGSSIVWSPSNAPAASPRPVSYSNDLGATWTAAAGIPDGALVSSDRVNPNKFYGFAKDKFYYSEDGGATFTESAATGLPSAITSKFKAVPGKEGDIWLGSAKDNSDIENAYGLFRSTDSGKTFVKVSNVEEAATIGFGKAKPGEDYMALYSYAKVNGQYGIYRSDDEAESWVRINDDKHQFGAANRTLTGDPRVYGRVYVGTNGLGIVIGEAAALPDEVSSASVTAGDSMLSVAWVDPSNDNLAKIKLTTSSPSVAESVYFSPKGALQAVLSGLTNGTEYTVKIQTIDTSGKESEGILVKGTPQRASTGNNGNEGGNGSGSISVPGSSVVNNTITMQAAANAQGEASVTISSDDLLKAIRQSNDQSITVTISTDAASNKVQVNVPIAPFTGSKEQRIQSIRIDTGFAAVKMSSSLLQDGKDSFRLTVGKTASAALPADIQQKLGGSIAYAFELNVDGEKAAKLLGKNDLTVELPYTLKAGEKPNKVVIYELDDTGKLQIVRNGKYDALTGKATFKPKHLGQYAAAYVEASFNDLTDAPWAAEAVEALAARGAVNGVGNGSFAPTGEVTRAAFITMLMNAFELAHKEAQSALSDVEQGTWYYEAIAAAEQLGIATGKPGGSFGVNDPITRQDMAVIIARLADVLDLELGDAEQAAAFTDEADTSRYAAEAVAAIQKAGLINGLGDGRFGPKEISTRAQAAVIIYRLFERMS
ncbi:S-layer homology domain-containing protein [Paenibacillus sp. PL91]|uniref:S-layer homology domain-containing protein n=1 Tax=Paenibacillus sp. PL91 TaxID=2729538 RepID=UPI00145EBA86|nr:S-layer homology domain-containing protein [Paenibacillus sp. PL91]MBC9201683.1 S-layer homology domain-containing protein [Paenibacillus sp. PL91]